MKYVKAFVEIGHFESEDILTLSVVNGQYCNANIGCNSSNVMDWCDGNTGKNCFWKGDVIIIPS